ncbi:hypothetical protein BH24ACT22_BH24ACT22_02780 [soil metagenome]
MTADEVKEKVRVGDYATMDRTLEKVGDCYMAKAMDDRIGVFVMLEALRAIGDHEATIHAVATSQEEVGLRGASASGSALGPTVMIALDITLAMDVPGGGNENTITELEAVMNSIKNCLGMRKTWIAKTIGRPWNSRFYGDFIQVHNTL